jgi:hypothetical protein
MRRYRVGKGKPPVGTRFERGKSGNPKGRPKREGNLSTELSNELNKTITVREGGVERKVNKRQAIIKTLVNDTLNRDRPSRNTLFKLMEKSEDTSPPTEEQITEGDKDILRRYLPRIQLLLA